MCNFFMVLLKMNRAWIFCDPERLPRNWINISPARWTFFSSTYRKENFVISPGDSIKHFFVKSLFNGGRIDM